MSSSRIVPINFEFPALSPANRPSIPSSQHRIITSSTLNQFTAAIMDSQLYSQHGLVTSLNPDYMLPTFHTTFRYTPIQTKTSKPRRDLWQHSTLCTSHLNEAYKLSIRCYPL